MSGQAVSGSGDHSARSTDRTARFLRFTSRIKEKWQCHKVPDMSLRASYDPFPLHARSTIHSPCDLSVSTVLHLY